MTGAHPQTLYDKIWDAHLVRRNDDGTDLIYVDRHFVHDATSLQAFAGLRAEDRPIRRPAATIAIADHNVSTDDDRTERPSRDIQALRQLEIFRANCAKHGLDLFDMESPQHGIVHVVGPEQGLSLPGTVIVCGDSHTSTHGALGTIAFGIGTTDVEHVMASQTIRARRSKTMRIAVEGELARGVSAKDLILAIIGQIGTAGATGHAIEYCGSAIERMTIEGRMTVCNMSIEAGATVGLIAPDEATIAYLNGRPRAPKGLAWEQAITAWSSLRTDKGAAFDREVRIAAERILPQVTWGTNPEQVGAVTSRIPDPGDEANPGRRLAMETALSYMGLDPGTALSDIGIDRVFIGSCTNSRIEDLRAACQIIGNRKVAPHVRAQVVPGSAGVRLQAEYEGLDRIFLAAGFEWRQPGCSMCVGQNGDILAPGERCASTSNRNFQGRQGPGGRTHLVSPATAAASAIVGRIADPRAFF